MKITEMYTDTRNYGCRIREYIFHGLRMVSLENSRVRMSIALDKGADIVEFIHKPSDTDVLWHSFNELKPLDFKPSTEAASGNFMDLYAGGWQDLFPIHGAATPYEGSLMGTHGEACIYPWQLTIEEDRPELVKVRLDLKLVRSPFSLSKTLELAEDSGEITIIETVKNLSPNKQTFMWGQHPAYGFPFLDGDVTIRINGNPTVTVPQKTCIHHCPFDRETTGTWPILPDRNGNPVDLSKAKGPDEKVYMEYVLTGIREGLYEIESPNRGLGVRMSWDANLFGNIWVWGLYHGIDCYPWYGRPYVLAVEPLSSYPTRYEEAKKLDHVLHIDGFASLTTKFTTEIYELKGE